ncbi:hypothetical protein BGZ65_009395, partial [Modicella reniformis]
RCLCKKKKELKVRDQRHYLYGWTCAQLLAYDTTQQKRRSKSADNGEAEIIADFSEELELEERFLGETAFKKEGKEFSQEDYSNINWKRGRNSRKRGSQV